MYKPYRQKFYNSHLYNLKKQVLHLLDPIAKNQRDGFVTKSCQTLEIPWTVACQALLSMGFSRQEYWSGLPFLLQKIFPTWKLNSGLLHCRQILYLLSYDGSQKSMYHDFIILIQPIQHGPGSSPLPQLHTSCFHFIYFICFPTSFSVSLPLPLCSPTMHILLSTSSLTPIRPLSAICCQ